MGQSHYDCVLDRGETQACGEKMPGDSGESVEGGSHRLRTLRTHSTARHGRGKKDSPLQPSDGHGLTP